MNTKTQTTNKARARHMAAVAETIRQRLGLETLDDRKRDSRDFHEISVASIRDVIQMAFDAGFAAATDAVRPEQPTDPVEMLATLEITKRKGRSTGGTWVKGNIAGHAFEALVFPEHAESEAYELDGSRISKLWLQEHFTHAKVACFERGWDRQPTTDAAIVSGRRFARLDMNRCIEWARVNRPALSGAGRGGWRPGSGRTSKSGTKRQRPRGTEPGGPPSQGPEQPINKRPQDDAPAWAKDFTNDDYVAVMIAAVVARTRLKELRYEEIRSRLVDRAEAEHWWQQLLQRFAERFAALPTEAADAFANQMGTDPALRPKIAAIIEKEIAEALAILEPTPFAALGRRS